MCRYTSVSVGQAGDTLAGYDPCVTHQPWRAAGMSQRIGPVVSLWYLNPGVLEVALFEQEFAIED
jgi:hypothetical protein